MQMNWRDAEDIHPIGFVLVACENGHFYSAEYDSADLEWYDGEGEILYGVRWWTELPEYPGA